MLVHKVDTAEQWARVEQMVKRFATLPPVACLAPPLVAMYRNVEGSESDRYPKQQLLGSAGAQLDAVHPNMG